MATHKAPTLHNSPEDRTEAVDALVATLDHPHTGAIQLLRQLVLGVHPSIREGVKWKSPSFRVDEYFATTHLRVKSGFVLILHLGAKVRELPAGGLSIADPQKRLRWLAPDRAVMDFADAEDLATQLGAVEAILRQWIAHL